MPSLSSDEEAGGGTADKEGQNVSQDITLASLQSAIELVSGAARDDAQAPGDAAPRLGKVAKEHLERDAAGHLLRLLDEPQVRDKIFEHWELNHCPASAPPQVKAQCPYFDADGKGCSSWLHPRAYDLKRHLLSVHGVEDALQYDLKA